MTVLDAEWNVQAGGGAYNWNYLHQGGRFDVTSGLYHFRHRDYLPSLGRWTSIDPIRYAAGDVNLYRTLGNGLPNRLDPSGLLPTDLPFPINPAEHGQKRHTANGSSRRQLAGVASGYSARIGLHHGAKTQRDFGIHP